MRFPFVAVTCLLLFSTTALALHVSRLDGASATDVDSGVFAQSAVVDPVDLVYSHASNVTVLEGTSPFVLQAVAVSLGALFLLVGACLVWVRLLRIRVAEKTSYLSELTAQLRSSYEAVQDGILAVSREGKVLAANQAFRSLLGAQLRPGDDAQHMLGFVDRAKPKDDSFRRHWRESTDNPIHKAQFDLILRHPEPREIVARVAPIRDQDPSASPLGCLWLFRDETSKRDLERRLVHAQKMDAIGRLAGGVAHNFNNMLTIIRGNVDLARDLRGEAFEAALESASKAVTSASQVARRLLSFSRTTELELEACDVAELLEQTHGLVRHVLDSSVRTHLDIESGLPCVLADKIQLEQVLLNMCVNARDAMPHGGDLFLAVRLDRSDDDQETVLITVRDTGTGFGDDVRSKIFEPFFTTKGPGHGTGLGLSVSYGVIQQHGGSIECESHLGVGSTFGIRLPARPDLSRPSAPLITWPTVDAKGLTVLVIDDEPLGSGVSVRILESVGFSVLSAHDGPEGMRLLGEHAVDLVILDMSMPVMSVKDVLRRIRRGRHRGVPVVLCSGYDVESSGDLLEDANASIQKPYSGGELLAAVRAALASVASRS